MREYIFTLKYRVPFNASLNALIERLGEAGLTDALPGVGIAGRLGLEFSRDAETAEMAVASAVSDVSACLPEAVLIEACPDYVGLTDIADCVNMSRQAMRKIMMAHPDFPAPVHDGTTALWHLSEVLDWFVESRKPAFDPALLEVARSARAVNAKIEDDKMRGAVTAKHTVPEGAAGAEAGARVHRDNAPRVSRGYPAQKRI